MAPRVVSLTINGEQEQALIEPCQTLLEVLRDTLGLTGAKEGCDTGNCGTCTVLVDGQPRYACMLLALDARGQDILTIEGLAEGGVPHPIQVAFVEHGAIQCGFCTPGLILSAKALLDHDPDPTEAEIRQAIAGNLCRCTGYVKVVEAIQAVRTSGQWAVGSGQ